MARTIVAALLLVAWAGCMEEGTTDVGPADAADAGGGDPVGATWFVLVEDAFTVSPGEPLRGDFGSHCEEAEYDAQSRPASLSLWGARAGAPFLVILRDYDEDSLRGDVSRDDASGLVRYDAKSGDARTLASPFDGGPNLAVVKADATGVRLDGQLLPDQEQRTVERGYSVEGPDGTRQVQETLVVRNLGRIDPSVRDLQGPCD